MRFINNMRQELAGDYQLQYSLCRLMELGISIVVFLTIAIVVMILFCLVTRYINKKLQRALEDQYRGQSLFDEIFENQQNMEDGEYEEFLRKREEKRKKSVLHPEVALMMEMTEIKDPLFEKGGEQQNKSRLKRRLYGQNIPAGPETGRSLTSLKSFRPEKLDSHREQRPLISGREQNKKGKDDITEYKYISKLVSYRKEGIFILENYLTSIKKTQTGSISEKKTLKASNIKQNQMTFEDALELEGFEAGNYQAFKYETVLEIPHMKENEQYPVKSLKSRESREEIEFKEYCKLKEKLEDEI